MASLPLFALTSFAMLAFAANSILCRFAMQDDDNDPGVFTAVRLGMGAAVLWVLCSRMSRERIGSGNWPSAMALLVYAFGFSLAYVQLPTATGALLLFAAVQATMIGYGLWSGERLNRWQVSGLTAAAGGLVYLLWPGLSAPPLQPTLLMLSAGIAWGIYSLRGRLAGDPSRSTAGNFLRAAPLAVAIAAGPFVWSSVFSTTYAVAIPGTYATAFGLTAAGWIFASLSGGLASGLGYALWYAVLPSHSATTAASVQLSVPVLTALGGIALLGESASWRLVIATIAVLGGIYTFLRNRSVARS